MGLAMYAIGKIASEKSNYAEALKTFFNVIKIAEETNDKKCIRNQHFAIGNVYYEIGNYTDALKHHLITLKMIKEMEETGPTLFNSYRSTGKTYHKLDNYQEALNCFFAGYKEAQNYKVANAKGMFYIHIGNVYKDQGNYDEALKYHIAALNNSSEVQSGFLDHFASHYTDIGIIYNKKADKAGDKEGKKNYSEALTYLHKGLDFAKKAQRKLTMLNAYSGLSEAYNGTEDYKNAMFYTKAYLALKDSLFNNEIYKKISELKVQHEMEKEQLQERARQQLALAEEKALREKLLTHQKLNQEKLLAEQKLQQETALAEEKTLRELAISDQKFEQEKRTAEERAKYDKSIALEKAKQETLKLEKRRMNTLWLIGIFGTSIISGLLFVLFRQRIIKRRAVEKAQALHRMAELELQSLRAQLNPHFMFNSLNSIQELILLEENDKSHAYLSAFADLLRMLLDNANQPFISLKEELTFLELYLSLENLRIPNLEYAINVEQGIDVEKVRIPNMMLQPYVENAIWHGLSNKQTNRNLQININQKDGNIHIEVVDNGIGRKKASEFKSLYRKQHRSKGMELLSDRFTLISREYGANIQTTITDLYKNDNPAGTKVDISYPSWVSEKFLTALS
jgi:tetratricopeptide (TPR) repeat protein